MNKTLTEIILGLMDHATPQAPMRHAELVTHITRARPEVTPDEISDHLETLIDGRQVSTCRITRGLVSQNVYWPTGLKSPALAGIKPKEPIAVPHQDKPNETLSSKLIKVIVAHGPLLADDLAENSGVSKNNIGGNIQHAIKTGSITTRQAYVPERGRELTYYMTTTQAQEWDARNGPAEQIEIKPANAAPSGHVMSHPAAELPDGAQTLAMAELENLLECLGAESVAEARLMLADRSNHLHNLRNDLAAHKMILANLAATLNVENPEDVPAALDELLHALNTRAAAADKPAGNMALVLIDSAELTEIEPLPRDMNLREMRQEAQNAIEQGHAARAILVNLLGEAVRRVEWKEAA